MACGRSGSALRIPPRPLTPHSDPAGCSTMHAAGRPLEGRVHAGRLACDSRCSHQSHEVVHQVKDGACAGWRWRKGVVLHSGGRGYVVLHSASCASSFWTAACSRGECSMWGHGPRDCLGKAYDLQHLALDVVLARWCQPTSGGRV